MTLEVCWNGSMDRLGTCDSLTGYRGASSLLNQPPDASLTFHELTEIQIALGMRPPPGSERDLDIRYRAAARDRRRARRARDGKSGRFL